MKNWLRALKELSEERKSLRVKSVYQSQQRQMDSLAMVLTFVGTYAAKVGTFIWRIVKKLFISVLWTNATYTAAVLLYVAIMLTDGLHFEKTFMWLSVILMVIATTIVRKLREDNKRLKDENERLGQEKRQLQFDNQQLVWDRDAAQSAYDVLLHGVREIRTELLGPREQPLVVRFPDESLGT